VQRGYGALLRFFLRQKWIVILLFAGTVGGAWWLFQQIPQEYAPSEDRGAFFVLVNGPEGASFGYMEEYMDEIERRLLPYAESGEAIRVLMRTPRGFGAGEVFNTGIVIMVMAPFGERRSTFAVMDEIRGKLGDLPGVRAFPVMRQGFGARISKPLQFVIGGGTYEELAAWRDILLARSTSPTPASSASTGTTRRPSRSCASRSTTTAPRTSASPSAPSAAPWRPCSARAG
jgi:multidrug efflux pump